MDPFTMVERLLGDAELTSSQLAQIRALNTRYFTELAAIDRGSGKPRRRRPNELADSPASRFASLMSSIASDIREVLTDEQRAAFDRNFPRVWSEALKTRGKRDGETRPARRQSTEAAKTPPRRAPDGPEPPAQ